MALSASCFATGERCGKKKRPIPKLRYFCTKDVLSVQLLSIRELHPQGPSSFDVDWISFFLGCKCTYVCDNLQPS